MNAHEASMYGLAIVILVLALAIHWRRRRDYVKTSGMHAAAGSLVLFLVPWNGVWNEQELWVVGLMMVLLLFFFASLLASWLVRFWIKHRV